jgi:hypothetical protein
MNGGTNCAVALQKAGALLKKADVVRGAALRWRDQVSRLVRAAPSLHSLAVSFFNALVLL